MGRSRRSKAAEAKAENYRHPEATSPMRPDVGTQAQFKKKKPPARYCYDSSLSPALDWDGQNSAREVAERQLSVVGDQLSELRQLLSAADNGQLTTDQLRRSLESLGLAEEAMRSLKALSGPFLNWAGKAERLSFDVPTLPLFIHERLSTKAIIETLRGHRRSKEEQLELFADPQHPIADQVLKAYEFPDRWTNRMILGDSRVVMNSLVPRFAHTTKNSTIRTLPEFSRLLEFDAVLSAPEIFRSRRKTLHEYGCIALRSGLALSVISNPGPAIESLTPVSHYPFFNTTSFDK